MTKKAMETSNMHYYCFADDKWKDELVMAYSFRFTEAPVFKQKADCITTAVNSEHSEGFDNISLLCPDIYNAGVKVSLKCAFEGVGCPEIIFVKKPEECDDGIVRYGECFEIVLWKNVFNVWRHFMDESYKCFWHKRLGLTIPISEGKIHVLKAEVVKDGIIFEVDDVKAELRTEDMFKDFHVGVTACEGIVRLYELTIDNV